MRNTLKAALLATALIFCLADPALAGPPRHGPYHGPHYRGHHHWGGAAAALIVGGILGAAIANSNNVPPPAPVVVTPPDPYYPNVWYFCDSARMYYPQTRYCPEGWRLIQQ